MPRKKVEVTKSSSPEPKKELKKKTRKRVEVSPESEEEEKQTPVSKVQNSSLKAQALTEDDIEKFAFQNKKVKKTPEKDRPPTPTTKEKKPKKGDFLNVSIAKLLQTPLEPPPMAMDDGKIEEEPEPKKARKKSTAAKKEKEEKIKIEVKKDEDYSPELKKKKAAPKKESKKKQEVTAKQNKKKSTETMDASPALKTGPINEGVFVDESIGNPDIAYKLPSFLEEKNIMDKNQRRPGEPGYDPTTLYIPPKAYEKFSNLMKQYWDAKSIHFDKLVAHNMADCYWFYYNDAYITSKLLDLKIGCFRDGKFFTYFSARMMNRYAPILLENGYKIVVVERVSDRLEILHKKNSGEDTEELVRREICQILTRGTYFENIDSGYSSRYALCVFEQYLNFGVVFLDATTHEFYIGEFKDDSSRSHFRTLLTRIKPIEVIYYKEYISEESLSMFKNLSTKPARTDMTLIKPKSFENLFSAVDRYLLEWPEILKDMKKAAEKEPEVKIPGKKREDSRPYYFTFQALGLCIEYLEEIMLAGTVFKMGHFYPFDKTIEKKGSLYLDSQALENLEILDVNYINVFSETFSLFGFMDRTVSPFGKRLFKRWITAPLLDPQEIEARLEAVDDLINNPECMDQFQGDLKKLSDLERMINRVYNLTDRRRMQALHTEDFALNRLKDFLSFLDELEKVEGIMENFQPYIKKFKSKRLKQLCTFKDVDIQAFTNKSATSIEDKSGGLFPRINHIIEDLRSMVTVNEDNSVMPKPGISKEIDKVVAGTKEIHDKLEKILEEQRKAFKCKDIVYATGRKRFELEFPEHLVEGNKRPKNFIPTSKKKGFLRFQTPEIEELVEQLVPLEFEFQRAIIPFVVDYFLKFYERNAYWRQVISCLSELDCLCSLARLAKMLPVRCRPQVLPMSSDPYFKLKNMVHPMAARNNPNFVPNSIIVKEPISL